MATRTSTTRTMSSRCELSADTTAGNCLAPFPFSDLVQAYFDCRRSKRNSRNALLFEQNLERNLNQLYSELINDRYQIGRSICFVITHPKPREVWAAAKRLESKVRSATQNWSQNQYYLKCDLSNFFVKIDKSILGKLLEKHIHEPWWLNLALSILNQASHSFKHRTQLAKTLMLRGKCINQAITKTWGTK